MERSKGSGYENEYTESGFWGKLARFARVAGREVVEKALWLYYAARRPDTPTWAKSIIYSALGYFILPIDAIPDIIPAVGYADDLGALAVAIATLTAYINPEVKEQARRKLEEWFGSGVAGKEQAP